MTTRLLDATASDFRQMTADDLVESIRLSEGRAIAAEVMCQRESPVEGVSHGELAAAMSADLIILDGYDTLLGKIAGFTASDTKELLKEYKRLLGRPLGVNVLCVDSTTVGLDGRTATPSNLDRLVEQGIDMICIYARPQQGGTVRMQKDAVEYLKRHYKAQILCVGVPSFRLSPPRGSASRDVLNDHIQQLLDAGCDGIALPMPGTKQGWRSDATALLIDIIHHEHRLAWLFITGSVEGAPSTVMHTLARTATELGGDVCRLDEAGISGMPIPENILAFSLGLRGQRHTYRRMAMSPLR